MLGNSSSGKELSSNTNALAGSTIDASERIRSSEDGRGSSKFGDSEFELVSTADGCRVTGCMVEGPAIGSMSVTVGCAGSSNSVEGCNMKSLMRLS